MRVLLIMLLFSFNLDAVNCKIHKLYCHILELQPKINKKFAMDLSNKLHKYSKIYKTNPFVSIAIAKQESSIRMDNHRIGYFLVKNEEFGKWELKLGFSDVGLFQFHGNTIKNYNLDPDKIMTDLDYNVKQHIILLRNKIKTCVNKNIVEEKKAFACYHSFTKNILLNYYNKLLKFFPENERSVLENGS